MTPLQKKLLEMLAWFHSFCTEHHLRYYILGGTVLGAVRHKGFIPWDDDVDIGMPVKDYKKFIHLTQKLPDPYFVETPVSHGERFIYTFTKLYNTQTTLVENQDPPFKRGIYLDIFPLCGLGNTKKDAQKRLAFISKLRFVLMMRIMEIRKERKWYKNFLIYLVKKIPSVFLYNYFLKFIHSYMLNYDFNDFNYVGNPVATWGIKEIMPREYFGTPTLYSFANISVYGPEKPDEYLTQLYGNWRELPPPEKQKSHHGFLYLNLEKSYLEENNI